jgi:hypothetical protein
VLAVVQDKQQLLITQGVRERLVKGPFGSFLDAQDGRKPVRDEGRIRDLGQLHQPHAIGVGVGYSLGKLDRKSGLPGAADAGQREQSGGSQPRWNTAELLLPANEAGQRDRQVVVPICAQGIARRGASPSHRRDRGSEVFGLIRWKLERRRQSRGSIAVGVRGAALELLNPEDAHTGTLGELLLRQPRGETVLPQQRAEGDRGLSDQRGLLRTASPKASAP